MGLPNEVNSALIGAAAAGGYEIEQSLRFADGGNYLTRTPSSAGSRTTWTHSVWVKYTIKSANHGVLLSAGSAGSNYDNIRITTTDHTPSNRLSWYANNANYSRTDVRIKDPTAWYHFVFVWNTTNGTAADRRRMYINGIRQTDFYDNTNPGSSTQSYVNNNWLHAIGALTYNVSTTSEAMDGYMAEVHFVDGQALDQYSFGEFNDSGVWIPKKYSGSYGTNGYYLKFDPNAANGIGHDHSGNGNNWTPSGFNTSGTDTDVMFDTPTVNYPTICPIELSNEFNRSYLSNGNLTSYVGGGASMKPKGTFLLPSSGKYYWEVDVDAVGQFSAFGVGGADGESYFYSYQNSGLKRSTGNATASYGSSWTTGDIIGVLYDADTKSIAFTKNGVSQGTAFTSISQDVLMPHFQTYSSAGFTVNFGQFAFEQSIPSGYSALNTANMPTVSIADGTKYFDATTYSGNTSTNTITGFDFSPDFVWIKSRSHGSDHAIYDTVRGANKEVRTNRDTSEYTFTDSLNSFNSNGFTLGTDTGNGNVNLSGRTYVSWAWDGGSSNSSNTNGSITSTVRANPSSGFSVVTYTGGGSSGTVGHGLGVTPGMILLRDRSFTGYSWYVYHKGMSSSSYFFRLNTTAGETFSNDPFNGTAPTSSVFSVGGENVVNTHNYVAYCFAEVENYCKIGTYVATDNYPENIFLRIGFKPRYFFLKGRNQTSNWCVFDTARYPAGNPTNMSNLQPNNYNYEPQNFPFDILANGVKFNSAGTDVGHANQTYIYMAIAEHPFGGSNVAPATAR